MSTRTTRYHVTFGKHRTTISVDTILSELLAIKLNTTPCSRDAGRAITAWLQEVLPSRLGEDRGASFGASFWARRYIIEEITDPDLRQQWSAWFADSDS